MPAVFEKYDTSFTCPSFARTRRSMVYSVLVFYSLRYFNKVLLSLFYAIMLIVFALEIHDNQLIWLKTKKYVTAAEYSTQFSEKVMVTLHNLLLVPLIHVRRSHSKIELEAINELQMERSNRLKELMKLEDEFACKAEYAAAQYKNHIEIRKIMEKNRLTDRRGKWLEIKRTPIVRREKYELYKQSQAVMALLKQLEAKKKDKEKLRNANREMRRNREKAAVEKTVARVTKSKSKKKETKEQNSEVAVEIDVTKVVKKDVTTKRKATVKPPDRSKTSKNKTLKTKKSARRGILKKPAKKESRKGL
uniref:Uncharacterized protein n=1 Tax=Caenorhabditis japonica TaxID=281687 RepID=A0A8R1ILM6_CAEJA